MATINYFLAAELFGQAEIYAAQRSYDEAQAANDQALRLAAQVERKEILFKAQLLLSFVIRRPSNSADRICDARCS